MPDSIAAFILFTVWAGMALFVIRGGPPQPEACFSGGSQTRETTLTPDCPLERQAKWTDGFISGEKEAAPATLPTGKVTLEVSHDTI